MKIISDILLWKVSPQQLNLSDKLLKVPHGLVNEIHVSDEIARVDDISLTTIIAKIVFSFSFVEFALQTSLFMPSMPFEVSSS